MLLTAPALRLPSRLPLKHLFNPSLRRPTSTHGTSTRASIPNPAGAVPIPPLPATYSRFGLGPIIRTFQAYGRAQRRRPYATQLSTSVGIYLLGDVNAQMLFGAEGEGYDAVRTLRMVVVGAVFSIPSFRWFTWLSDAFAFRSKPLAIASRVLVNQLFFTPPFLALFFGLQGLLSGDSISEIKEKVTTTLPTAFFNSCRLWPAVTALNFWLVPWEYRALFGGVVAVGWNGYLSYLNQKAEVAPAITTTTTTTTAMAKTGQLSVISLESVRPQKCTA